ncbi:MAG: hypothetical protein R3B07_06945 [Polyangiaceae bacterium]
MTDVDTRRQRLENHFRNHPQLPLTPMSEADVRSKLIDPLFVDCLGWPETQIRRERHTDGGGYIDYEFGTSITFFLVEAKRDTARFKFAQATHRRDPQLAGLMSNDPALKEACEQAARYCQDEGIPYAIVTNGRQLIMFNAVRTDRPWRKGTALVFRNEQELLDAFNELWDVLSYVAVRSRSLDRYFSPPDETPRHLKSVIGQLPNADQKLVRNALSAELIPVIKAAFDDLTDTTQARALEHCYVYSHQLQSVADDFILTIRDLPPKYLSGQIEHLRITPTGAEKFENAINRMTSRARKGSVLLLLGGVGAGKTTFLRQVRVKYCSKVIEESGAFFYVDFRGAPRTPPFEPFVFRSLREQLDSDPLVSALLSKSRTSDASLLNDPGVLAHLFEREVSALESMARVTGVTDDALSTQKFTRLVELAGDDRAVVARVFRAIQSEGRFTLLALDNADQHALDYQLQIFLFAQNLASETGANIICALREEKYYLASQQGAFNAFYTHRFHIPSPRVRDVLSQRLVYSLQHLDEILEGVDPERVDNVRLFLNTVLKGGIGRPHRPGSSNVVRLLERICLGDIRRALKMFRRFLRSGNTDVQKIQDIARQYGTYYIPFHEFTKSVMLDDRMFYREGDTEDEILNVFAVSGAAPNSHFTTLRILSLLMENSEVRSSMGSGFVEWDRIVDKFERAFGDGRDAHFHLERLLYRSLIESDTGITDSSGGTGSSLDQCRAVRATASGEYYLTYLVRAFAYMDLVWIDTPLSDTGTLELLRSLVGARDRSARFERVDTFVGYLLEEEEREFRDYPTLGHISDWGGRFVPRIAAQLESEKRIIRRRFARYDNRARQSGDGQD